MINPVAVNNDHRRILPALMGITQLDTVAVNQRRLMGSQGGFENPGQFGRG